MPLPLESLGESDAIFVCEISLDKMEAHKSSDFLQDKHIRSALVADKGTDVLLQSWFTESFIDESDSYASNVKKIKVSYSQKSLIFEDTYVVKMSTGDPENLSGEESHSEFTRECGALKDIIPKLDIILRDFGMKELSVPKYLTSSLEMGKEFLILKDLQTQNYKMNPRIKGFDARHTNLILEELAKVHAVSYLLQQKSLDFDLKDQYPEVLVEDEKFKESVHEILSLYIENAFQTLKAFDHKGYDEWLRLNRTKLGDLEYEQFIGNPPFDVVCHGDCWSNNFLFRYDENNEPLDVVLVDFQGCRKSSLASDIVELMYRSVDGVTRNNHLESFLTNYFNTFKSIFETAGEPMPYNFQQLRDEYTKMLPFGLLQGLVTVPWMISEEGLQSYEGPPDDKQAFQLFKDTLSRRTVLMLQSDLQLQQRFLSIFDDMSRAGII